MGEQRDDRPGRILADLADAKAILDAQDVPKDDRWFGCPFCGDAVPLDSATEHFALNHTPPPVFGYE